MIEPVPHEGAARSGPVEQRRRVPRQGACWFGRYRLESDRRGEWHECLVVDISTLGVGLDVEGGIPKELMGQWIEVEVNVPASASVNVRLRGEVRHAAQDVRGGARIGIEFSGLSDIERSILDALEIVEVG
jgi:c-di-GMP-binding flagellar brake protein YcgR